MDESIYSEKTIRLPNSFWCYDPLGCGDVQVNDLPAETNGYLTFGSLINFCKINDATLNLWAQAMRAIAASRHVLLACPGRHRQRTIDFLSAQGIGPDRVRFLNMALRREYLSYYHQIDVSLDSLPYNGHTTSLDSLWMGVPVVTLVGNTVVGRAGWSQVSNLGLTELAAATPGEFVRIAVALAHDRSRLKRLRTTLRSRMERSSLMDARSFARNIESAYRHMWRQWCG
jgi:predicted O-linked N-acetylglucosamine transferase (SPINDLY family)